MFLGLGWSGLKQGQLREQGIASRPHSFNEVMASKNVSLVSFFGISLRSTLNQDYNAKGIKINSSLRIRPKVWL